MGFVATVIDDRWCNGVWPALGFRSYNLSAFHHAPTVIGSALDSIDQLPIHPADVADPEITGSRVEAHLPRIAKAVCPDFRTGARRADEWVISRNSVRFSLFTEQGVQNIKDTCKRANTFKRAARKMGVKVKSIYWTLGTFDGALIFDASDDETATALMLNLGAQGNVQTKTARAFDAKEMDAILSKLS